VGSHTISHATMAGASFDKWMDFLRDVEGFIEAQSLFAEMSEVNRALQQTETAIRTLEGEMYPNEPPEQTRELTRKIKELRARQATRTLYIRSLSERKNAFVRDHPDVWRYATADEPTLRALYAGDLAEDQAAENRIRALLTDDDWEQEEMPLDYDPFFYRNREKEIIQQREQKFREQEKRHREKSEQEKREREKLMWKRQQEKREQEKREQANLIWKREREKRERERRGDPDPDSPNDSLTYTYTPGAAFFPTQPARNPKRPASSSPLPKKSPSGTASSPLVIDTPPSPLVIDTPPDESPDLTARGSDRPMPFAQGPDRPMPFTQGPDRPMPATRGLDRSRPAPVYDLDASYYQSLDARKKKPAYDMDADIARLLREMAARGSGGAAGGSGGAARGSGGAARGSGGAARGSGGKKPAYDMDADIARIMQSAGAGAAVERSTRDIDMDILHLMDTNQPPPPPRDEAARAAPARRRTENSYTEKQVVRKILRWLAPDGRIHALSEELNAIYVGLHSQGSGLALEFFSAAMAHVLANAQELAVLDVDVLLDDMQDLGMNLSESMGLNGPLATRAQLTPREEFDLKTRRLYKGALILLRGLYGSDTPRIRQTLIDLLKNKVHDMYHQGLSRRIKEFLSGGSP